MKKNILFLLIIFTLMGVSGCNYPPKRNPNEINADKVPRKETMMAYDQMVSAVFREPFDLKFGQTAQIKGTDITITPQNIKTFPCGICYVNYGFQVTTEIHYHGQTYTVDVSNLKSGAVIMDDFSIIITKYTPVVDVVNNPSYLPLPRREDYSVTFLVQDIPTTSKPPVESKAGFPMTLKLDGKRVGIKKELGFSSKDLEVTAKKVTEDSRCPSSDGFAVSCNWSGQVVVVLEIKNGDDMPTLLKVSSIEPAVFNDVAFILNKVDPPNLAKNRPGVGTDVIPIVPQDYIFHFEVKKASDLPQKSNPPLKSDPKKIIEQIRNIYNEAKVFFPKNGVVFFVNNNDEKNHRIVVDFDTSTITYAKTINSPSYSRNIDKNPEGEHKAKITFQDLQKIEHMAEQVESADLDNFMEGKLGDLNGISIVVISEWEPVGFEQSGKPSAEMKAFYDYVRDFTSID